MPTTTATAAQNARTNADIKREIYILGEQYATAMKAHQKASDNLRKLQQKKEENSENILSLTASLDRERCPEKRVITNQCIRKNKITRTKILKNLEDALKVEERKRDAMEEAEAMWKFEAMCSGEVYQENGQWK
ncbi:unnamed protein product [Caenorhabditis nigoni]